MKKKRLREYPPVGTVICFPLHGKGYAYAVKTHNDNFWHYNFVTDRPVADGDLFKPERWFQHVTCLDEGVGADTMDVTVVQLSEAQLKYPKTWSRVSDYALQNGAPTPYKLHDPDIEEVSERFRPITEAELPKYQEKLSFTYKQWMDWLESQSHRLEQLEVTTDHSTSVHLVADKQTMKANRLRKFPPVGTVMCIQLTHGGYAYAVMARGGSLWLYNFTTDQPVADVDLFKSERWFQFVACHDGVSADTMDVATVQLSQNELKHPRTWHRVTDAALRSGVPTPYQGYDPDIKVCSENYYHITEADLPDYQEYLYFTPKQLVAWLDSQRHRLQHLEVASGHAASVQPVADNQTFEPQSVFEIWLSELEKMELTDFDDIKDAIEAELDDHGAGEVIGSGHVVGDDQHNIAVKNAPGKRDEALACIRRVLLRLKASPETSIWEQRPDEPDHIDHPLIAPVSPA